MWKIFPIYSFLYLFQRKWLIVEEKSYLSIFWNFQTQFYPQNHSPFFFVCLRLSKIIQNIYFARENCVFMNTSWRKFAKTIGYNYFCPEDETDIINHTYNQGQKYFKYHV